MPLTGFPEAPPASDLAIGAARQAELEDFAGGVVGRVDGQLRVPRQHAADPVPQGNLLRIQGRFGGRLRGLGHGLLGLFRRLVLLGLSGRFGRWLLGRLLDGRLLGGLFRGCRLLAGENHRGGCKNRPPAGQDRETKTSRPPTPHRTQSSLEDDHCLSLRDATVCLPDFSFSVSEASGRSIKNPAAVPRMV